MKNRKSASRQTSFKMENGTLRTVDFSAHWRMTFATVESVYKFRKENIYI